MRRMCEHWKITLRTLAPWKVVLMLEESYHYCMFWRLYTLLFSKNSSVV